MRKQYKSLFEYLDESKIKNELNKKEIYKIQNDWFRAFCKNVKSKTGKWVHNGYMWHAFSYNLVPSLQGDEAVEAYLLQHSAEIILLPEIDVCPGLPAIIYEGIPDVEIRNCLRDFHIFPKNFAWSMAFTHEEGWLGPYFVKNEKYNVLNKKNLEMIEAKQKGYF